MNKYLYRYVSSGLTLLAPATAYASLDGLSGTGTDFFLVFSGFIFALAILFWTTFKFINLVLLSTKAQLSNNLIFMLLASVAWYLFTGFLYFFLLIIFSRASGVDLWNIQLVVFHILFQFPWPRIAVSFFFAMITLLLREKYVFLKNNVRLPTS